VPGDRGDGKTRPRASARRVKEDLPDRVKEDLANGVEEDLANGVEEGSTG
jgi:hypothetical protein